jgi:hypothetical protein
VRVNGGLHNLSNHHSVAGPRGSGSCGLMLAVGVPSKTQSSRPSSSSSRVSQSLIHDAGAFSRTIPGLSLIVLSISSSLYIEIA